MLIFEEIIDIEFKRICNLLHIHIFLLNAQVSIEYLNFIPLRF